MGCEKWGSIVRSFKIFFPIRAKLALILGFAFAVTLLCSAKLFSLIIIRDFEFIERQSMSYHIDRAQNALSAKLNDLENQITDWAKWDDTYNYIKNRNKEYLAANVIYPAFEAMKVSVIAYFNANGGYHSAFERVDNNATIKNASLEIINSLKQSNIRLHENESSKKKGIIRLAGKLYMFASLPIQDSAEEKKKIGTLIFVSDLDDSVIKNTARQTRLVINGWDTEDPAVPQDVAEAETHITNNNERIIEIFDDSTLRGYTILREYDTKTPLMVLRIEANRPIYLKSLETRDTIVTLILCTGFVTLVLTILLLYKFVLARLSRIRKEMSVISHTANPSLRLPETSQDELTLLARDMNFMLSSLESTQSQLSLARDAAQSANLAKSLFIAKVSHELRTPISSITGMHRIILKKEKSRAVRELIKIANDSAWSLLSTINEILDFSKAESGNLTVEKIPFDVREVVRDAMRVVSGRLEGKEDLELVCDVAPNIPPKIEGDPTKLKQALVNLLGNSVKFTAAGYVMLRTEIVSQYEGKAILKFEISDTGIGIPKNKLGTIFDPFKQVDATVTRQYQGTGLGLTIVKQFCEAMGGSVSVDSNIGEGTQFTILLPAKIAGETQYRILDEDIKLSRILLIDGKSKSVSTIEKNLKLFGFDVLTVNSQIASELDNAQRLSEQVDLVVISDEALGRSKVFNLVVERTAGNKGPTIAILKPALIDLREKLYSLGIKHVLTAPTLAEDVVLAYCGKITDTDRTWGDNEEGSLKLSKKLKVLVADDAATNRMILENMLGDAGHEVVSVCDGQELIMKLMPLLEGQPDAEHFDLVLTDIQMPIMDGFEATKAIRQIEIQHGTGIHMPIIAVTAHAMSKEQIKIKSAGVDGVVTKPILPAALGSEFIKVLGLNANDISAPGKDAETVIVETELDLGDLIKNIFAELPLDPMKNSVENLNGLLDIHDVFERSGDSIRRTKLILNAFHSSFKEPLARLAKAKNDSDTNELKKAAHALKGLLLDIGSKSPGALAGTIEEYCRDGMLEEAKQLIASLTNQTLLVAQVVERLCETIVTPLEHKREKTTQSGPFLFDTPPKP